MASANQTVPYGTGRFLNAFQPRKLSGLAAFDSSLRDKGGAPCYRRWVIHPPPTPGLSHPVLLFNMLKCIVCTR